MTEQEQYFSYQCYKGLKERGLDSPQYRERLEYEIEVILRMGFATYFLIIQDVSIWAKSRNVLISTRGSAGGSLVAYCLSITHLDPIKWNLLFERFLNPGRANTLPDIDQDIETRYRTKVIDYIKDKYGKEYVAHIGTFNLMRAKAAVKSAARTLGHPYSVGEELSKLLLNPIHGRSQPLATSLKEVPKLLEYYNGEGSFRDILRWGEKLEDTISAVGVHACGLVISPKPLLGSIPLLVSKDGELTTQWDMKNIEDIGLIKFDFLSLDTLDKIHVCLDLIEKRTGVRPDLDKIELEDPAVFERLRSGDVRGVFQLEASSGMRDLLVRIRPNSIKDLCTLVAIFRPGPLGSPEVDYYLKVRSGDASPRYLVPELKPILSATDGLIIYQEQVMEIAKKLCGYTPIEADDLRKAIGKKDAEKMAKHESKFKNGWVKNHLDIEKAKVLWGQIVAFASYGFNLSHAAAYAMTAYQTAWLKLYYPLEFMCSYLMMEAENRNHDKIIQGIAECSRLGISVRSPNITSSNKTFTIIQDAIQFGLGPIKNLGACIDHVLDIRRRKEFLSWQDFVTRIDPSIMNRRQMKSLIMSGALDSFGHTRSSMEAHVDKIFEYKQELKAWESKQETYEKKVIAFTEREAELKIGIKKKAFKKPEEPLKPIFPELELKEEYSDILRSEQEFHLLGYFLSSHPLSRAYINPQSLSIELVKQLKDSMPVMITGVVTQLKEITTKVKKQKMGFITIEDLTGSIEATVFARLYETSYEILKSLHPIQIEGTVEIIEVDDQSIANIRISKLSQVEIHTQDVSRVLDICVPLFEGPTLARILLKYTGELHKINIVLESNSGSKIHMKKQFTVGNYLSALIPEVERLGTVVQR